MKNVLTIWLIAASLGLIVSQSSIAQQTQTQDKSASQADEPGKCILQSDSGIISKITVTDLKAWCEKAPFHIGCQNNISYILKSFEFTTLTMKPFMTKSYGVGDQHLMPILGVKAIDKLKTGDTVIFKDVVATNKEGKEVRIPTLSVKIEE